MAEVLPVGSSARAEMVVLGPKIKMERRDSGSHQYSKPRLGADGYRAGADGLFRTVSSAKLTASQA